MVHSHGDFLFSLLCCLYKLILLLCLLSSYTNFALLQSSDSGSESGIQTQKSVESKSSDDSNNSTGSNDDENASVGLNARDGSDNGSGTQVNLSPKIFHLFSYFLIRKA